MDTQKFIDLVLEKIGVRMENNDKISRAVFGTANGQGLVGGVGKDAKAEEVIAKYDEIGGYITKDGFKVKNGIFFDKKTKKSVDVKKITILVKMNGEYVEHVEGEEESLELKVAKKQAKEKKKEDKE